MTLRSRLLTQLASLSFTQVLDRSLVSKLAIDLCLHFFEFDQLFYVGLGIAGWILEPTDVFGAAPDFDIVSIREELSLVGVIEHTEDVVLGI